MNRDKLSIEVDGRQRRAQDISWAAASGGFAEGALIMTEDDALSLPFSAGQGAPVTFRERDGSAAYEGRMVTDPWLPGDGYAYVGLNGHRSRADKAEQRGCFQSRDTGLWTPQENDPYAYVSDNTKVNADILPGGLRLQNPEGTAVVTNDDNGAACWIPDVPGNLTRVAWNSVGNVPVGGWVIQILRATGPSGTRTVDGADISTIGAIDRVLAAAVDLVNVRLIRTGANATSTGSSPTALLRELRVNGLADNRNGNRDIFYVSDVMSVFAGLLGYDPDGIASVLINALPFDWESVWSAGFDYAAMLGDAWWRVLDDRGDGPYTEANTWANSKVWTISRRRSRLLLRPLERYNRIVVHWVDTGGRPRHTRVSTPVSSLDARGLVNAYHITLSDPQPNDTLATAIATTYAPHLAAQRWEGTIEGSAFIESARDIESPRGPLPGDIINVPDFDDGAELSLRITDTAGRRGEAFRVGVGADFPPIERTEALSDLSAARRRRVVNRSFGRFRMLSPHQWWHHENPRPRFNAKRETRAEHRTDVKDWRQRHKKWHRRHEGSRH